MNYHKKAQFIIILLSLLGLAISLYLYFPYVNNTSIGNCLSTATEGVESGCDIVRTSKYANLFNIPMPVWGFIFYGSVLLANIIKLITKEDSKFDYYIVVGGFLFSIYLTFLEVFVIKAICIYCVGQAIVSTAMFVCYTIENKIHKNALCSSKEKEL